MITEDMANFIKYVEDIMPEDNVKKVEEILRNFSEDMRLNEDLGELELKFKYLEGKVSNTLSMLRRKFI